MRNNPHSWLLPRRGAAELVSWAFDEQPLPHSTLLTRRCDGVAGSNSWVEESAQFTHIAEHKQRSWQAGGYIEEKRPYRLNNGSHADMDQRRLEKYIQSVTADSEARDF